MAYLDLRGTQYTLPNESMITDTDTVLDGKYRVEYIEDLWTSVPSKFYPTVKGVRKNKIAEGQQVYIAKGSMLSGEEMTSHKGEVWVLINKENIEMPLFDFIDGNEVDLKVENPGWKKLGGDTKVNLTWENL